MDGVFLAADTRVTYSKGPGQDIYVDQAMKVLHLAPGTAIGYVGRVETAAVLLKYVIDGRDHRERTDPISLMNWLPRVLRAAYQRVRPELRGDVAFMVGSSLAGRPMLVETTKVREILFEGVKNGLNSIVGRLPITILSSGARFVSLTNTCAGLLYVLRSPGFELRICPPLQVAAIGSGHGVIEEVRRVHARVLFDYSGNVGIQAYWFRQAIADFVERNDISSVGGLYPVIRVRGNDFLCIGQSTKKFKRGTSEIEADVTLSVENGCWVQRNRVTGKEIKLELPWNIPKNPKQDIRFDDIDRRRSRKVDAGDF
ncbi:MAG: hypothetical protein ABFD89_21080 [Bryobacteraceae bacterium]